MRLSLRDPDVIVLGWLPGSEMAGSDGGSRFNFLRNLGRDFISPNLSVPIHEGSRGPAFPIELIVLPSPSLFCSPQNNKWGDELLEQGITTLTRKLVNRERQTSVSKNHLPSVQIRAPFIYKREGVGPLWH